VRWPTGGSTLPTDYTFTGQRDEAGLGLMDYHARFYDPYLGRFVQADTIVPEPGNPQDLNRYSYVRNNALRYVDPTGFFSEEEIMGFFDVETWEQVLAYFEEGGSLEGKWGWLQVLRMAEVGDHVTVYSAPTSVLEPYYLDSVLAEYTTFFGTFAVSDGTLYLEHYRAGYPLKATQAGAASSGNFYRLQHHQWSGGPCCGLLYVPAGEIRYHTKFDPSQVDWTDVTLDAVGAVASIVAANEFVEAAQVAPDVAKAARAADAGLSWFGVGKSLLVDMDPVAAGLSFGGFAPGPIGGSCNVASMYWDLKPGFYQEP
jgi:RHS repeat-associated protein